MKRPRASQISAVGPEAKSFYIDIRAREEAGRLEPAQFAERLIGLVVTGWLDRLER